MSKRVIVYTFFICILISVGNADEYTEEGADLLANPWHGKTLVVGKLTEEKNGFQTLIPVRGWTRYPPRIPITRTEVFGDVMRNQGTAGKMYFMFSLDETDKNNKLRGGGERLIPLNAARNAIDKLADRKDVVGEINPSWQFCESDNECTLTKNQCAELIGVNKKYEKNYLSFLKSKKLKVDCSKADRPKVRASKCVENFCS